MCVHACGRLSSAAASVSGHQISFVFFRPRPWARAASWDHKRCIAHSHVTHGAWDVVVASVFERRSGEGLVLDTVEGGVALRSFLESLLVFRLLRQTEDVAGSPGTGPVGPHRPPRVHQLRSVHTPTLTCTPTHVRRAYVRFFALIRPRRTGVSLNSGDSDDPRGACGAGRAD